MTVNDRHTNNAKRLLPCPKCGQTLRIPSLESTLVVTCPACRHRFNLEVDRPKEPKVRKHNGLLFFLFTFVAIVATYSVHDWILSRQVRDTPYIPPAALRQPNVEFSQPTQQSAKVPELKSIEPPPNGMIFILPQIGECPFEVVAPPDGVHRLVKVEDWTTREIAAMFFIRSGDRVSVKVPTGSYRIKVAYGQNWYGPNDGFGPNTSCLEFDTPVEFISVNGGFKGHSVSLQEQVNGNIRKRAIGRNAF